MKMWNPFLFFLFFSFFCLLSSSTLFCFVSIVSVARRRSAANMSTKRCFLASVKTRCSLSSFHTLVFSHHTFNVLDKQRFLNNLDAAISLILLLLNFLFKILSVCSNTRCSVPH